MPVLTERQRDFLTAAINIVSKDGFSRLTIRNVAAAVGVTEPAVYRHFPNKLALMGAMLDDLQSVILPHFNKLGVEDKYPQNTFSEFIFSLFKEFKDRPAYSSFIFSEEIFHNEPQLKQKVQSVMEENIKTLTESFLQLQNRNGCRRDIPAREIALLTLASIRLAVSRWHANKQSIHLHELAENLVFTLTTILNIGKN